MVPTLSRLGESDVFLSVSASQLHVPSVRLKSTREQGSHWVRGDNFKRQSALGVHTGCVMRRVALPLGVKRCVSAQVSGNCALLRRSARQPRLCGSNARRLQCEAGADVPEGVDWREIRRSLLRFTQTQIVVFALNFTRPGSSANFRGNFQPLRMFPSGSLLTWFHHSLVGICRFYSRQRTMTLPLPAGVNLVSQLVWRIWPH